MLPRPLTRSLAAVVVALVAAMAAFVVVSVARDHPEVRPEGPLQIEALTPGLTLDQTIFVPGCALQRVTIPAERPSLAAVHVELFDVVHDDPWPPTPFYATLLQARAGQLDIELPRRELTWHSTLGIRLRLAPGTTTPVTLLVRTQSAYGRGWLARDGVRSDTDDLVFTSTGAQADASGGWRCAVSANVSPFDRPAVVLALVALFAVLASGCAATLIEPAHRTPRAPTVAAPLAMVVVASIAWLTLLPPFEGPDEYQHFEYARYVAREGGPPDRVPLSRIPERDQWVQEPLYYLAIAPLVRLAGTDAPVMDRNPRAWMAGGRETPLLANHEPLQPAQARHALWLARGAGVVLGALTAYLFALALGSAGAAPAVRFAWVAAYAAIPAAVAQTVLVNNDTLATLLATAAFVLIGRYLHARDTRWLFAAGVVAGLAFSTKLTTAWLGPGLVLTAWLRPGGPDPSPGARPTVRRRVDATLVVLVGVLAGWGWLLVRNTVVFGDPLAIELKRAVMGMLGIAVHDTLGWRYFVVDVTKHVFRSFWGIGWTWEGLAPRHGSRLWLAYAGVTIALVAAAGTGVVRAIRTRGTSPSADVQRLAAFAVIVAVAQFYVENAFYYHVYFRHVLSIQAPLLVLAAAGATAVGGRLDRAFGSGTSAGAAGLVVAGLAVGWLVTLRHVVMLFHFGY